MEGKIITNFIAIIAWRPKMYCLKVFNARRTRLLTPCQVAILGFGSGKRVLILMYAGPDENTIRVTIVHLC